MWYITAYFADRDFTGYAARNVDWRGDRNHPDVMRFATEAEALGTIADLINAPGFSGAHAGKCD